MNIGNILRTIVRVAKPIVKAAPKVVEVVKTVRGVSRSQERDSNPH